MDGLEGGENPVRTGRIYPPEARIALLRKLEDWKGSFDDFCREHRVSRGAIHAWRTAFRAHGTAGLAPRFAARARKAKRHMGPYSPDQRLQAVEAFKKSGMTPAAFANTWRVSPAILRKWISRYDLGGARGLINSSPGRKRGPKGLPGLVTDQIVGVKEENPDFGLRRVRDFLLRFRGIRVSTGSISKTFAVNSLPHGEAPKAKPKKHHLVRRFERSRPGELWQSDITSMVMPRSSQRLYLVAFVDDYSRFVVSWGLHLQQKSGMVIEALLEGIARFGKPAEILTDQGRQYVSWRGKAEFQLVLAREGIRHVVSRAHHPETLGKCERFWETLQNEFWRRINPADLPDARERLAHFIAHFNHFRTHQGIGGLVPADRFFGAESAVRKALESAVSRNQLDLATGNEPRKSVYLTGLIGDTPVSLTGERGHLVFHAPDGTERKLEYHQLGMPQGIPTSKEQDGNHGEAPTITPINPSGALSEPGEAPQKDASQAGLQDAPASRSGEGPLEISLPGRAEVSPPDCSHGLRALDGQDEPQGARSETGYTPGQGLADCPGRSLGHGLGSPQTTQNPAPGNPDTAGGQPQTPQETDRFPGTPELDPHGLDCGLARPAGGTGSSGSGETGSPEGEKKSAPSPAGSEPDSPSSSGQDLSEGVTAPESQEP